jgi:hypothetical protein
MTTTPTIRPAEERLLDAALAQVLGEPNPQRARATPAWLAAALVLLGVAVTAASMGLARATPRDEAQHAAPAPLPPAVDANGRQQLEALPATTTVSLRAGLTLPADAAVLARFGALRALTVSTANVRIAGVDTRGKARIWSAPPADTLAPLAQLPALERLVLSSGIAVTPALLAPLARCARLRELELQGERVALDDALVTALRALPALRSLRLDLVPVDAAVVARLRSLPLTAVRLSRPIGFDEAAFAELLAWPELERLGFGDLGHTFGGKRNDDHAFWLPLPDQWERLASLPRLRELELHGCALTDAHLAALPATLTALSLQRTQLTPDGWQRLDRFTGLRHLEFSPALPLLAEQGRHTSHADRATDAIARALGALRLSSLRVQSMPTPALCAAIAAQPALVEVELRAVRVGAADVVDALARAPALRRVTLCDHVLPTAFSAEQLAPLRDSRTLREVVLELCEFRGERVLDEAAVRAALGERVALQVHRTEYGRPKR